ncbi:MAG: fructose-bisphosphate aldolase [Candidatus Bathyarchaeia archaeon]
MDVGKTLRLGKIFREDGRTFIVAMDHGMFGPIKGLEEPVETIKKVIAGKPDAIMTNLGIIKRYARELSALPSVILTIPLDAPIIPYIEEAVKLGVDAIKIGIFAPLSEREKYRIISPVSLACERWGMPLLAEVVPVNSKGSVIHDTEEIKKAARIAAELGADFVKIAYTGSLETFKEVIRTCPVPVTILGGAKMETEKDVLEMAKNAIDAGGAGVAFGRNIWQHENPTAMVKAIRKIIHENATVEEALKELK